MSKSPIPAIPPLSSIKDPATRAVLQAIIDGWRVRNGELGNGDEKFLTVADLKGAATAINTVKIGAGGVVSGEGSGGNAITDAIAAAISDVSRWVINSRLYRELGEPLKRMEIPPWFTDAMRSAVKTETKELANETNALAEQTTTAIARINDSVGIVQTTLKATADEVSASTAAITDLQASVGEAVITGQEAFNLSADIEQGLKGTYTVKMGSGDYVTGFGLSYDKTKTHEVSMFGVRANAFFIGPPELTAAEKAAGAKDYSVAELKALNLVPFSVVSTPTTENGKTYTPGVYLSVPLKGVSGAFSGELLAATGTFTGTLTSASFSTGTMKTGVQLIDQTSNYEVKSVGAVSWGVPTDTGVDGTNVQTDNSLIFYYPGSHAGAPVLQRICAGSRTFSITANAVVDTWFSIWYRKRDIYGNWGSWAHLVQTAEGQSGYGPVTLALSATEIIPSTAGAIQIGVSAKSSTGAMDGPTLKYLSVSAMVVNW